MTGIVGQESSGRRMSVASAGFSRQLHKSLGRRLYEKYSTTAVVGEFCSLPLCLAPPLPSPPVKNQKAVHQRPPPRSWWASCWERHYAEDGGDVLGSLSDVGYMRRMYF